LPLQGLQIYLNPSTTRVIERALRIGKIDLRVSDAGACTASVGAGLSA